MRKVISESRELLFFTTLFALLFLVAGLLIGYLIYAFHKENREYDELVSYVENNGYVFATEVYRLPAKKVVNNICGTTDVVFIFDGSVLSYKKMNDIENIYMKKHLFCKA